MENLTDIEVRYQETDQMGIVYHANYLVWFEIGRTKFTEALGFDYTDMETRGILSPVIDAHISYLIPVKYGELVQVKTCLIRYSGIRAIYEYKVMVGNKVCVIGKTTHVIVEKETFKPRSLRKHFPEWHEAYLAATKEI